MEQELQAYIIRFGDTASHIYTDVFEQYRHSLSHTDRSSNENIYKLQEAKAVFLLKNRLEQLAAELLEKNQAHPLYAQLHAMLTAKIDYYLNEFRHRAASE